MAYLGKEYKHIKDENFADFLKVVGIPEDKISKAQQFKPTSKLLQNGNKYTLVSTAPEGPKELTFESGVEFDDTSSPGMNLKTTCTVDGNTLTQVIKSDRGTVNFKHEYNGDELVVTITTSNWEGSARRYFKA